MKRGSLDRILTGFGFMVSIRLEATAGQFVGPAAGAG